MSDPKLISPLLDGFVMGAPISSHHGVRCCPAMKQDSDHKYIVKIISIPQSQTQLDALLLTGAYKDPADAMDYFKEIAEGIVAEAELLSKCAKLEGFLAYENWQVEPMEDNQLGYDIYLVGSYKRSLERYMVRSQMTHLEAVTLGMDICGALAACRRAGSMYIDLKPSNIFLSEDREFRIGDLGFAALDSLRFTSLPEKYRSSYMAPEILDPMNTLNETADTYCLGRILYQIYNGGILPQTGDGELPPPAGADEEMWGIIHKAIAADPADRWQEPAQMGKALADYLQFGNVTPEPIEFPAPSAVQEAPAAQVQPVNTPVSSDTQVFSTAEIAAAQASQPAQQAGDTRVLPTQDVRIAAAAMSADTQVVPTAQTAAPVSSETKVIPDVSGVLSADTQVLPAAAAAVAEKIPDPAPQPPKAPYKRERRPKKKMGKAPIIWLAVLVLLGALGYGGLYYYRNYYLQPIRDLSIVGEFNALTVHVDTDVDESLLSVSCTDTYGNSMKQPLVNGQASFSDLLPNSQYKIALQIEGFHQLVGKTSDVFNTESRTEIVSFSGITGAESGSVMLTFTVDGPEPEEWLLTVSAEGEEDRTQAFTGHSVTVVGLTVDAPYTFTLSPTTEMHLTGQTTLEFTPSELVMAQNLSVISCVNGEITIQWDTPENKTVENWAVRIYSDSGYDQTQFVLENIAVFTEVDPSQEYFIEVTANAMTQPARTSITANPITITGFQVDEDDLDNLTVRWDHLGQAPEGGWLLMYSLDDSKTQSVVKCEGTTAVISPRIHGSSYHFILQAADSTSIFSNVHTYQCPDAQPFAEHGFDASRTTAQLLTTPGHEHWTDNDVNKDDYTDEFSVGERISVLLRCDARFYIPEQEIQILYVIRNAYGDVLTKYLSQETADWKALWLGGSVNCAELDIPAVPEELGTYTISIYFNNQSIAAAEFSITE